ncbi:hypothetical protein ACWCO0_02150 [Streptomyces tubercidicus]
MAKQGQTDDELSDLTGAPGSSANAARRRASVLTTEHLRRI